MLFRSSTRSLLIAHNLQCPPRTTHTLGPATRFVRIRQFHRTQLVTARKSSQDKDSINRDSIEYTRSGTDEQISRLDEAAYDPNSASPEEQQKKAAAGSNVGLFGCGLNTRLRLCLCISFYVWLLFDMAAVYSFYVYYSFVACGFPSSAWLWDCVGRVSADRYCY